MTATALTSIDLTDLDNFADGFPHDVFAELRRDVPVFWHEATEHTPDGEGFWSVVTHAETLAVMVDAVTYSSETGGDRPHGGTILPDLPTAGQLLNMMDDPRHARIRRLVSKGFTPRLIQRLESDLRRWAGELLDVAVEKGEIDFVTDVATELPLMAICLLLGVPDVDRHQLAEWVDYTFDFRGRNAFETTDDAARAGADMMAYGVDLIAAKRAETTPTDDLLSVVVHAELPDESPSTLTDGELLSFFTLLFAAGADTTRGASAGGVHALADRADEYARLRDDRSLLPTAVDECVRWMSPSAYNRRTATATTTIAGHTVEPGQKVVFWEASANRDDAVFVDPMRFDVGRDPNPHLGFGHGAHHCLGASLARLEIRVILDELLDRAVAIAPAGPPEWTRSNKHNGLRHLPLSLTPAG